MWLVAGSALYATCDVRRAACCVLRAMRRVRLAMLFGAAKEGERTAAAWHTHRRGHTEHQGAPLRTHARHSATRAAQPRTPPRKTEQDRA